jgi:hypothetical protein
VAVAIGDRVRLVALAVALSVASSLAACGRDKPAGLPPPPPRGSAAVAVPLKQPVAPPKPAELQHVTIKALGMYCEESCPLAVRYALQDNTDVYELGFDPSNEAIFVSYDKSKGTPKAVTKPMLDAIKKAGFDPWLAKDSWPDDAKVQVVLR